MRASFSLALATFAAFALILLGETRANAFCQTTTTPIPEDWPQGKCYDQGHPLFWKSLCVGYSLSTHESEYVTPAAADEIAAKGFSTWTNTQCSGDGPDGTLASMTTYDLGPVDCDANAFDPNGPNQHVIFFSDDAWPYGDSIDTLGTTFVTFDTVTGEIYDADMAINTHAMKTKLWSSDSDVVPDEDYDLQSIITHEAGHFLGLAHSDDQKAVMYPDYTAGSQTMRALSADDTAAICELYRPDGTRVSGDVNGATTTPSSACDPTPRGGFTSECTADSSSSSSSGGCALARTTHESDSRSGFAAIVGVAIIFAARRRQTRPPRKAQQTQSARR